MKSFLIFGFLFISGRIISQEMVDTNVYATYCHCVLKTFHETDSLLITQIFAENERLTEDLRYYMDGRLERVRRFSLDERPFVIQELNINNRHMEFSLMDTWGRIILFEEIATDSFDAIQYSTFSNCEFSSKGFHRLIPVQEVCWINDTAVGTIIRDPDAVMADSKVGLWYYYYQNGIDSAIGKYSYSCFEQRSIFVDNESGFIMMGISRYSEIKTGVWNYFSPAGKLIRREEWEEGNLLKREFF